MTNNQPDTAEIHENIGNALLEHFGTEPAGVKVFLNSTFLIIHLEGFSLSTERILLKQNEAKRAMEMRDLLMAESKPELIKWLSQKSGQTISGLYADWNLEKGTGMLIAVMDRQVEQGTIGQTIAEQTQKELLDVINNASKKTEKKPDYTGIHQLTSSVLLVERHGIMVDIEKELIKNGVINELRLAKRPLEHRLLESAPLETVLKRPIQELFVDWDFVEDKAYMVLLLDPLKE